MIDLTTALSHMKIQHDEYTIKKFYGYMDGILSWNEKINLTAITDHDEFLVKHFIDSLICCNYHEFKSAKNIVDVGTGAGFPGVPLAIVSPEKNFVLLDSLNKRLKIVNQLCNDVGINNVKTVHGRAEDLARQKEYREKFDLCVSRAVANLPVLLEYCLPFIKVGGYLMGYKGPEIYSENDISKNAVNKLGGTVLEIRNANLDGFGIDHNIILIKKLKSTPSKFPRKAGIPSKEPL